MPVARTALKFLLGIAIILALFICAIVLWLRFEYARVQADEREQFDWNNVVVGKLDADQQAAAPCAQQYSNNKAWFGALHVHTNASYDATSFGSLTSPDDAYAFAQGKPIALSLSGDAPHSEPPVVRISSPLDFMAVTDHAESLGEVTLCYDTGSTAYDVLACKLYRGDIELPVEDGLQPIIRLVSFAIFGQDRSTRVCGTDGSLCRERAEKVWQDNQRSTQAWQDHSANCEFTTFHAYEYTLALESSNLHRNVIFKSATVPQAALSAKDAQQPELLWQWLVSLCIDGNPDCDALAIPHNSNWSSGRMWFPYSNQDLAEGEKRRLAALRARIEPLAEILQVKGDSECRNGIGSVFGAPDEHCDFEKLRSAQEEIADCGEEFGQGGMLLKGCTSRYSYVRYALTAGLAEQQKLGVNPFKLGILAATDTHNGTPTAGLEKNNLGAHGFDRERTRRLSGTVDVPGDIARGSPVRYNPGGIAGIYAEENSRTALFDAMQRRETFGTSGPRITPRFFGGWNIPENLCEHPDYLAQAYERGVPMGSDLAAVSNASSKGPVFVVSAQKDSRSGGNLLQRIQIIKGWNDDEGLAHQAVIDVAGNGENGASVDPSSCKVSGPGFAQLCATWRDPEFDPARAAVYYARVLENPSCRWSTYDCLALEPEDRPPSCSDPELPWQIQERAWTSPIWYQPAPAAPTL